MDKNPDFSLLDSDWIQVLLKDGRVEQFSIREVFARSDDVIELLGESPTQGLAIMRLLLAVTHRALDGPKPSEWLALFDNGELPLERVNAHLEDHSDRFWLFHPTTPFYQVADLHSKKNEISGLEKLIADVPTGGPLFIGRSGQALLSLSFAEAARWLVQLQGFDVSGIKTGAVGDPRVKRGKGYPIGTGHAGSLGGVYVKGESFNQTLILNLVTETPVGSAVWERMPHTAAPEGHAEVLRPPSGVADLYTWQSRRVRLVRDGDSVTGVVVTNGDKINAHETFGLEPMTMWRRSRNQEKALKSKHPVYLPKAHDPAKSLWRSAAALFPAPPPSSASSDEPAEFYAPGVVKHLIDRDEDAELFKRGHTVTLRATGMQYGTQNAVTTEVVSDDLTFQVALLRKELPQLRRLVQDAVSDATEACKWFGMFAADLVRAAGGDSDAQVARRDTARESGYEAIDKQFRNWLASLDTDSDIEESITRWHRAVRWPLERLRDQLIATTTPSAYQGRTNEDNRTDNVATADRRLYYRLRKAIPEAYQTDSNQGNTE